MKKMSLGELEWVVQRYTARNRQDKLLDLANKKQC
jgi:hypothetical protein